MTPYAKGTLRSRIHQVSERALALGALKPIETRETMVTEAGIGFPVRVAENLVRKANAPRSNPTPPNPFLPPDPDLAVSGVSDTHLAVLNKFPVVAEHLLIVTRAFASQTSPITVADFESWSRCLSEFPSLGFYNSGRLAGASQAHKHFQQVPLPISPSCPQLPLQAWIDSGEIPFRHHLVRFSDEVANAFAESPRTIHAAYRSALAELGIEKESRGEILAPYNLLLTREWLLVVPRTRETWETVSINGLGFAGSLFVRTEKEAEAIRRMGPHRLLQSVSEPLSR